MKAVFVRVLEADDKAEALKQAIADHASPLRFEVNPDGFEVLPRAPFAYWASDRVRLIFRQFSRLEAVGRMAKVGLQTSDDFRFVRQWTEIPAGARDKVWFPFAKGGEFSRYYADVYLVVNWAGNGEAMKAWAGSLYGNSHWSRILKNTGFFFRPGMTWSRRTQAGLSLRALAPGCVFADKGPAAFLDTDAEKDLLAILAVTNSGPFAALVELQMAFGSYEVGVLQNTPVPQIEGKSRDRLAALAHRGWSLKRSLDIQGETSHAFVLPALLQVSGETLAARASAWAEVVAEINTRLTEIQVEIDQVCSDLYGLSDEGRTRMRRRLSTGATWPTTGPLDHGSFGEVAETELDSAPQVAALLSWVVGVAFGRFDLRYATGERAVPPETEPFERIPACSPGMLTGDAGIPLDAPPSDCAIHYSDEGFLVDDTGALGDLLAATRSAFERIFDDPAARWEEAADVLGDRERDLRGWFAREFFEQHIKRYSRSRRKAPIYWQLATPTASYSVWLYYHRFTRDTIFRLLNDHVAPKLRHEEGKLTSLTQEVGPSPSASQRREIDDQERFVVELRAFRDEVARVAPLWSPDLNDGVIINFAPLWRLVPQNRSWQKECKKVWDKLVAGDYDWAHLAMHLWPERVVPRCAGDRSLAITHGLETTFWEEDEDGKWEPRSVPSDVVDRVVKERTSAAVKSAVNDLLRTPRPSTPSQGRRVGRGRRALSE